MQPAPNATPSRAACKCSASPRGTLSIRRSAGQQGKAPDCGGGSHVRAHVCGNSWLTPRPQRRGPKITASSKPCAAFSCAMRPVAWIAGQSPACAAEARASAAASSARRARRVTIASSLPRTPAFCRSHRGPSRHPQGSGLVTPPGGPTAWIKGSVLGAMFNKALGASANYRVTNRCPKCHGTGKTPCSACGGRGQHNLKLPVEEGASAAR